MQGEAGERVRGVRRLAEVAADLGLAPAEFVPYGREMAKLPLALLEGPRRRSGAGRLVLVSAITPTAAGEGKTTISIALGQGLARIGESVCLALREIERHGFAGLPICIAKVATSLSDDPQRLNRPRDFEVTVREIQANAGAGFLVVLTGDILRMPGLPKHPLAERVDLRDGEIVGVD